MHSNILVRRGPRGKPELILLDHGLYRELSDSFRASFCRFWRSLVMQDKAGMIKYGREVGAGDKGELLASMFSGMRGGGQYALVGPTQTHKRRYKHSRHRHRPTSADTHKLRHRHAHERADTDTQSQCHSARADRLSLRKRMITMTRFTRAEVYASIDSLKKRYKSAFRSLQCTLRAIPSHDRSVQASQSL